MAAIGSSSGNQKWDNSQKSYGEIMSNKTPAVLAAILTVVLLVIFSLFSVFMEMIALNGASEKQGTLALGVSLVCNGLGVILLGVFSGWFTNQVILKFNWNRILAVVIAVMLATMFGSILSFASVFLSIIVAGIR
jgi:hypothetical protein